MTDFIDIHVHPPVAELLDGPISPYLPGLRGRLGVGLESMTTDDVAEYYRQRDGRAVLLGWDAETVTRTRPFSSEDVAAMVDTHPDVFIGFGSIDPARGARAVAGVHTVARLGLPGLAFHPIGQGFDPASHQAFSVYEAAAEHGLVCLIHTGYSRLGADMPGGTGLRLSYGNPLSVDSVAATFPNLQIVIAHLGRLWRDEAVAVAAHKPNVWLNLVGASGAGCVRELDSLAGLDFDRCVFGSDWGFASLDDALAGWSSDDVDPALRRRVLYDNSARLLGLDDS